MYNSGEAAEQVVRMSLEGAEFALKISGAAAKNIAAALYTVLKDQKKTKGKTRIASMLRQQRAIKIYTLKKEDCPEFARQAKGYGILYAPIPVRKGDDTIDVMVFESDAGRVNRIVEKFDLTVVDTASLKSEIEKSRKEREQQTESKAQDKEPENRDRPEKSADDQLLDELLAAPVQKEKQQPENPQAEKNASFREAAEKSHPSAPTSESRANLEKGTSNEPGKPSVRKELQEIQAQRKKEEAKSHREEPTLQKKSAQKTTTHRQPKPKKKSKSKER